MRGLMDFVKTAVNCVIPWGVGSGELLRAMRRA
jgi:hypothetical protein